MSNFKIGAQARLKQPVIEGEVKDIRFNKDANELEYELNYVDAGGETQSRWFLASELESANA